MDGVRQLISRGAKVLFFDSLSFFSSVFLSSYLSSFSIFHFFIRAFSFSLSFQISPFLFNLTHSFFNNR